MLDPLYHETSGMLTCLRAMPRMATAGGRYCFSPVKTPCSLSLVWRILSTVG